MTGPSPILTWRVAWAQIPTDGLDVTLSATPAERAALAAAYDLVEVKALTFSATLTGDAKGRVSVDGRLAADLVQSCGVTLVPVDQRIDEPVLVRFVGADSPERPKPPKPGAEVVIKADEPDPPEILGGPWVDLGAVAEEHFVLAIDPYPRAPGAELPAEAAAPPTERDSPFAPLVGIATRPTAKR